MSDFTEANREFFDKIQASYKGNFADVVRVLTAEVLQSRQWISDRWIDTDAGRGEEIKMLDYACGPGYISMTLAPFFTKLIGVDVSDNMLADFNQNAKTFGFEDKVRSYNADLVGSDTPAEPAGSACADLDLLAVSMALHHFEHPFLALKRFSNRLKKGGVCFIIDLVAQGDDHEQAAYQSTHKIRQEFGEAAHTVKVHGFSRETMTRMFQEAGLNINIEYKILPKPFDFTMNVQDFSKTVFFVRAQRS